MHASAALQRLFGSGWEVVWQGVWRGRALLPTALKVVSARCSGTTPTPRRGVAWLGKASPGYHLEEPSLVVVQLLPRCVCVCLCVCPAARIVAKLRNENPFNGGMLMLKPKTNREKELQQQKEWQSVRGGRQREGDTTARELEVVSLSLSLCFSRIFHAICKRKISAKNQTNKN